MGCWLLFVLVVWGYLGKFRIAGQGRMRGQWRSGIDKPILRGNVHLMPHDHHDHDHPHALLPPAPALRVKALGNHPDQKGLVDPAALDVIIDTYENKIGPRNGAHVVARAWSDPAFPAGLMRRCRCGGGRSGLLRPSGRTYGGGREHRDVHNMVVCTLCSCYPWPLLGIPPGWYKSDAYRARAVREPRKVSGDFGVSVAG